MSVPQSTLPFGIYEGISGAQYNLATLKSHLDAIAAGGFSYVVPYGILYLSGDTVMSYLDYAGSLGLQCMVTCSPRLKPGASQATLAATGHVSA